MRTFFRAWCFLTGQKLVALRDFDGEIVFRPAKESPFGYTAKRQWPTNLKNVILADGGKIEPAGYVEEWRDA